MTEQSRPGRTEFPIIMGFFWFIASTIGLWFVIRAGDPTQITGEFLLLYTAFAAINFFAFEWGRICGHIFYEWWANYILVFISAAASSIVLWFIWGVNSSPKTLWTIDAVERSNFAAMLFLVLIIPACYGVYSQQRKN
jgi:hypothetical protein